MAVWTREQELRSALQALMDAVDYTQGACRMNEQVGAVLPLTVLERAHDALRMRTYLHE